MSAVTTPEPLWRRALQQLRAHANGCAQRKHPVPAVGDVYAGTWRVEACLGPGRRGRADLSFAIRCMECGRSAEVFEFNLRTRKPCLHGERPTRILTPHGVVSRLSMPSWPRCSECLAETGGKAKAWTRIAIRDGLCAMHISRRERAGTP